MNLTDRKNIRLKGYNYSSEGLYFITICTYNRNCILSKICITSSDIDGKNNSVNMVSELTEIGQVVKNNIERIGLNSNIQVANYVIMPNHIHLILSVVNNNDVRSDGTSGAPSPTNGIRQNQTIPKAISGLKRFVNKEIGRDIWQRSYYDRIIRNEKEYEMINDYVNHNPETWGNDKLNDNIICVGNDTSTKSPTNM